MGMEMLDAAPEDVLKALNDLEETIQAWKDAVKEVQGSGAETMHIARGPYRGWDPPIPGPPPPFSGCEEIDFLRPPPHIGCFHFDIDIYTQQVCGFLLGLYYGLQYDRGGDMNP